MLGFWVEVDLKVGHGQDRMEHGEYGDDEVASVEVFGHDWAEKPRTKACVGYELFRFNIA